MLWLSSCLHWIRAWILSYTQGQSRHSSKWSKNMCFFLAEKTRLQRKILIQLKWTNRLKQMSWNSKLLLILSAEIQIPFYKYFISDQYCNYAWACKMPWSFSIWFRTWTSGYRNKGWRCNIKPNRSPSFTWWYRS